MADRLAIIASFRSEHGGLHDHVADQVACAVDLGFDVTLACPPGPFADSLKPRADVVETDFADPVVAAQDILRVGMPSVIHAHPALARTAAFALKDLVAAPLLVTYHGSRPETLTAADPRIDIAVTVSDVTRRFIVKRTDMDPARIAVIPNAVDTDVFTRTPDPVPDPPVVLFASRWDDDKGFVVDVTLEALRGMAEVSELGAVDAVVAGDGTRLGEIEAVCSEVNATRGRESFRCIGWVAAPDLARHMAASSVVVSPGRGALQAMSVGRATVALGSRGYIGFLEGAVLLQGADANFGSSGLNARKYPAGRVASDIRSALARAQDPRLIDAYEAVVAERTLPMFRRAHARVWGIALSGLPARDAKAASVGLGAAEGAQGDAV